VIVKARAGTGGPALARYLEGGKNEHAEVLELRNMDAPNLKAALFQMDALAKGSQCEKHALHVQMRAAHGEHLSADHWREAADRYAEAFGLQDHQAAVILHHQKDGCTHCHLVFNRVHPETLKAVHLSYNYATHKELARKMEQDWKLKQVSSQKQDGKHRDYSNGGRNETEQARRVGEDIHAIRDRIRTAWEQSDDGQSFTAALGEEGFTLAQGDRRDFVAVDDNGHVYSIGKRTTGANAAAIRERMAGLGNVPTIEEARLAIQLAKEEEQKLERKQKGKKGGEASAANIPGAFNQTAEHRYGKGERGQRFYISTEARRKAWEQAAANRIERMRERHARQYEKQQQGFEQKANLERGEVVQDFNHMQRHDLTQDLLKKQAEELAKEYQRQQEQREKWAKKDIYCNYYAENRTVLDQYKKERVRTAGGFKTQLREELTRQKQQAAHVGATNDNHEPEKQEQKPQQQQEKTPADEYREKMQRHRGQRRTRKPER
jgi:hypothetical protein